MYTQPKFKKRVAKPRKPIEVPNIDDIRNLLNILQPNPEPEYNPEYIWQGLVSKQIQVEIINEVYFNNILNLSTRLILNRLYLPDRYYFISFIEYVICARYQSKRIDDLFKDIK